MSALTTSRSVGALAVTGKALMGKGKTRVHEESTGKGVVGKGIVGEGVVGKGVMGEGVVGKCVVGEGIVGKGVVGEGVAGEAIAGEDELSKGRDEGVTDVGDRHGLAGVD